MTRLNRLSIYRRLLGGDYVRTPIISGNLHGRKSKFVCSLPRVIVYLHWFVRRRFSGSGRKKKPTHALTNAASLAAATAYVSSSKLYNVPLTMVSIHPNLKSKSGASPPLLSSSPFPLRASFSTCLPLHPVSSLFQFFSTFFFVRYPYFPPRSLLLISLPSEIKYGEVLFRV